jgi:ActR/RegA family two-component response regulator
MPPTAMQVETCCDMDSAMKKLCRSKFEAVIIDLSDKDAGLGVFEKVHASTSHQEAVTFAVVKDAAESAQAFQAGATFVLQRPLSAMTIFRTLRAAYPMMVREKRRYFRCPVEAVTFIKNEVGREFVGASLNISEGGLAIQSSSSVRVGEKLEIQVRLPGKQDPILIMVKAEVCWSDATGRAGLHFVELPKAVTEQIQSWLAVRLQDMMPNADWEEHLTRDVAPDSPVMVN